MSCKSWELSELNFNRSAGSLHIGHAALAQYCTEHQDWNLPNVAERQACSALNHSQTKSVFCDTVF